MMSRAFNGNNKKYSNQQFTDYQRQQQRKLRPLTYKQYENFLDKSGHIISVRELRISIYRHGIEADLRPIVWKHLLNIYPPGMNEEDRIDYLREKSELYFDLKRTWRTNINDQRVDVIYNMVSR